MASNKVGTNYFTQTGDTGVFAALTDTDGNVVLARASTANKPSSVAGYQIGCLLINITTGSLFVNTGTAASCTFVSVSNVFGS